MFRLKDLQCAGWIAAIKWRPSILFASALGAQVCCRSISDVSSQQELDLGQIGLEVLTAAEPEEKAYITLAAWNKLLEAGSLSDLPPLDHLSTEQRHELEAMPSTDLPGHPTNSLKSLLHKADGDWKEVVGRSTYSLQDLIPSHPARPAKPDLVGGEYASNLRSRNAGMSQFRAGKEFKRPKVKLNVYLLHALAHVELNACGELLAGTLPQTHGTIFLRSFRSVLGHHRALQPPGCASSTTC